MNPGERLENGPKGGGPRGTSLAQVPGSLNDPAANELPGRHESTYGVSPKPLHRYLDGFVFRLDRRFRETELFVRGLQHALDTACCSDYQLTAERTG